LRKKVRITPVPLVVELVDRSAQEPSLELRRRPAAPCDVSVVP
jgi:hypothetical protein